MFSPSSNIFSAANILKKHNIDNNNRFLSKLQYNISSENGV